nr:hybrid signal transduction histidine kinase M [Tanacetum cinerariifolium]
MVLRSSRIEVAHPNSAKEDWDLLTNIVKDNKWTHASTLKTKLRSIQLGALSMEAYFQKIKSFVTTLTSLDCVVNDEDVEMCLKYKEIALPVDSSSPMGTCRFRETCRYVHDTNVWSNTNMSTNSTSRGYTDGKINENNSTYAFLNKLIEKIRSLNVNTLLDINSSRPTDPMAYSIVANPPTFYSAHNTPPAVGPAQQGHAQPTFGINSGPISTSRQATTLPNAFTAETLQDPSTSAWNIDTGLHDATSTPSMR